MTLGSVQQLLGLGGVCLYGFGWVFYARLLSKVGLTVEEANLSFTGVVMRVTLVGLPIVLVGSLVLFVLVSFASLMRKTSIVLLAVSVLVAWRISFPYHSPLLASLVGLAIIFSSYASLGGRAKSLEDDRRRTGGRLEGPVFYTSLSLYTLVGLGAILILVAIVSGVIHRADELASDIVSGSEGTESVTVLGVPILSFDRVLYAPVPFTPDARQYGCGLLLSNTGGTAILRVEKSAAGTPSGRASVPSGGIAFSRLGEEQTCESQLGTSAKASICYFAASEQPATGRESVRRLMHDLDLSGFSKEWKEAMSHYVSRPLDSTATEQGTELIELCEHR